MGQLGVSFTGSQTLCIYHPLQKRLAMTTKYKTSRQVSCSSEDIKLGNYSATAQLSHAFVGVYWCFVVVFFVCLFWCFFCFLFFFFAVVGCVSSDIFKSVKKTITIWETVISGFKKVSPAVRTSSCNCTGSPLDPKYCPAVTLQHCYGGRPSTLFRSIWDQLFRAMQFQQM